LGVPDAKMLEPDGRHVVVYDYHRLTARSTPEVAFRGFVQRAFGAEQQRLHVTVGPDGVVEQVGVQPADGQPARTPPTWPWTVTALTQEP
jgi:hypothetical protein